MPSSLALMRWAKRLPRFGVSWRHILHRFFPAREIHVGPEGDNRNPGTRERPLRTIQQAANVALPGDVITVHEGIYRERVNPLRGGTSDLRRITYQAAPGEKVEILGSEVVKGWVRWEGDVWEVHLPALFFGSFNPYADRLRGDWFEDKGRIHQTGAVYLDGTWLSEAGDLDELRLPGGENPRWFARVTGGLTTIWAEFRGVDPNLQKVEINVRQSVFYPDQPGRNFITVRGFILRHAATPWAPPTAEQIGLIGTHWSKGWIIENNTITHSKCVGITLGKYGDRFDNTSADTAEGYLEAIRRAHRFRIPWNRKSIGHHRILHNHIFHCEQAGIVGSMGASFSRIVGNVVHDVHEQRRFSGAELAGIKFHGAIDTEISGNLVFRCHRGLWLDWMTQGTRISKNLFYDNDIEDVFLEVNHGPFLLDHNVFLSPRALRDLSQGGAYVHNLFAGSIEWSPDPGRATPYHPAHSTTIAGLANLRGGDNRFMNNLFLGETEPASKTPLQPHTGPQAKMGHGLWIYDHCPGPILAEGNLHLGGARPFHGEKKFHEGHGSECRVEFKNGDFCIRIHPSVVQRETRGVGTERLGKTEVSRQPFLNPDGSVLRVEVDFFGKKRNSQRPTCGPFEMPFPPVLMEIDRSFIEKAMTCRESL
jgi:alpha-N-arabinofuranosidase